MNEELVLQKIIGLEESVEEIKVKLSHVDLLPDIMNGQDKMIRIADGMILYRFTQSSRARF